jgi:hypothetical protein
MKDMIPLIYGFAVLVVTPVVGLGVVALAIKAFRR